MGWIKNVREFFWPLLEEESSSGINELVTNDVIVNQNNLQKTLDYILIVIMQNQIDGKLLRVKLLLLLELSVS